MVYEIVKKIADEKDMSIREIEQMSGIGNGTIGKWRTNSPRLDSLKAVAKVLGVPISDLLGEEKGNAES